MVTLLKNDIEQAISSKFGLADHCKPIKWTDDLILAMAVEMSYFTPKGKARLKPVYHYFIYQRGVHGSFRYSTKAKALQAFKQFNKKDIV